MEQEPTQETAKPQTMRHHWFAYVAKIRKKMSKQKKAPVSHREAMREASVSWSSEKLKIKKKLARAAKNNAK